MISGNFPGYLETFQIIRKLPKLSGHFPDYLETFQFTRKLSRTSGNFPDYLETFQTIWKLSRLSGNFPDHPETPQCNFKGCAQKLSGRAKTFWMAMPRCHDGFCASASDKMPREINWILCQLLFVKWEFAQWGQPTKHSSGDILAKLYFNNNNNKS